MRTVSAGLQVGIILESGRACALVGLADGTRSGPAVKVFVTRCVMVGTVGTQSGHTHLAGRAVL